MSHLPTSINLDDPSLYINRELSWLQFNRRVLEEAQDSQVPMLERLKFLAIFASNLDEFFMVRVGNLQQKVQAGISRSTGADKMPPREQLERIGTQVRELILEQYRLKHEEIFPVLEREGIIVRHATTLNPDDLTFLREVFRRDFFPVLTPLAIDPGHPFPHLLNKSLNLAVVLQRPKQLEKLFAVVQVPAVLPRFVRLPSDKGIILTPLETTIRLHLEELFPGMQILETTVFRVTRDSEYEIEDEEVDDLLKAIEEGVKRRRLGNAVRLEIHAKAPLEIVESLTRALGLEPSDVYQVPGLLDLTGLFQIYSIPGFSHLRDPHFTPQNVPELQPPSSQWSVLQSRDVLMHHPYETFSPVVDFIEHAAADERVLAIKQTLYRTSSDSPIVRALQRAADAGEQVTAVIELKARLDEERNILWARQLEQAGVHVVFGLAGLKTHCKVSLVVRREEGGTLRRYVHLATGNYNPQTARLYTDLGFFTTNEDIAEDVTTLFNYLTGYSEVLRWRRLIVAPSRMQDAMIEKIEREIQLQNSGQEGRIIAKINGLLEPVMVQALYRASQAGVKIDLICRGICALRPGIPGISENIRVVSIVDRFLEHSRIFYFGNAGNPDVLIGSADWMDRNLSRRVEVVFPIDQPDLRDRVINEVLKISLADNVKARLLQPDGSYVRVQPTDGETRIRSQERFLEIAKTNAQRKQTAIEITAIHQVEDPPKRKLNRRRSGNN